MTITPAKPLGQQLILFICLIGIGVNQWVNAQEIPQQPELALPTIEDADLLGINQEIKDLLDSAIRPLKTQGKKTIALHALLFSPRGRDIQYAFADTKTAQSTFDSKSGNCLSQAALFVAAARYLGLAAVFQKIKVPPSWEKGSDFYFVPGHLNVYIRLPHNKNAVVEFAQAFIGTDQHQAVKIKDREVLAEYYNNKGAEALNQRNIPLAIAYFRKSIEKWRRMNIAWSNLGVAYKFMGDMENAERAYLKALKLNARNLSTITNIYQLYTTIGETKKAEKYYRKVEKYSNQNPYKMYQLAEINIASYQYNNALKILKKALSIKPEEVEFHQKIAEVYNKLGLASEAEKHLERTREITSGEPEQQQ